jgi:signal transduction histidine kinase
MTLRLRLVLTTLAVAVPVVIASGLSFRTSRQQRDDDIVTALVLANFSPAVLDACEASPPTTPTVLTLPTLAPESSHPAGGDGRVLVFTYDRNGRSSQPGAPAIPRGALDEVQGGAVRAGNPGDATVGDNRQLLIALPRDGGPCALALVAAPPPGPPLPPPHELLIPLAFALVAGLVGIWPVVRRLRSLTLAVRRWEKGAPLALERDAGRDELSELSRALSASALTIQRQHADLIAREKTLLEFIENTTHDLAIPLTVLQGNLSTLAKERSPEAVAQAMNEAQYIGALLGNLALSAKFDAAAQVETSLDLRDVVPRVVLRHQALASRLGVEIERSVPEEPVIAKGDPTFTERALSNLVDNALRHNASGGHVAVVLETEQNEFVLRVLDDGPGLTAEECERVLKRGERGDAARSRGSAGSGLGLAIVVRVAQVQHWRFALTPGEAGGLVAELRGPVEEPSS